MTIEELRTNVRIHFGPDGTKALVTYGMAHEREGFGAGLLVTGTLVALTIALWPWAGVLWYGLMDVVW